MNCKRNRPQAPLERMWRVKGGKPQLTLPHDKYLDELSAYYVGLMGLEGTDVADVAMDLVKEAYMDGFSTREFVI